MASSEGTGRIGNYERETLAVGLVFVLASDSLRFLALRATIFILGSLRAIDVVGVHLLVLLLLFLSKLLPILALLSCQTFPLLADCL